MPVRIKDGIIPYTGGQGIEITDNHVINVLLREMNNLIQVNGDRELYVDLQLPSGIKPTDTFPVGVTTGKILQADGWQQSGLILNWKTTSGDYNRLIYANDGKLYHDKGDGVWVELGGGAGECKVNIFPVPEKPYDDEGTMIYDDITDIVTSALHNDTKITVLCDGEGGWEQWFITGIEPRGEDGHGHIYAINYYNSMHTNWELKLCTMDLVYEDVNNQYKCLDIITKDATAVDTGSTAPEYPDAGSLRYDTANSALKIYDGSNRQTV